MVLAEAVPGHIQALQSPDSGVRHAALDELLKAVIHQGTRWQVCAHVVPFVVRLIDHPDTPDRGALTKLLRHVGLGPRDDLDLPFDPEASFAGAQIVTKEQEDLVTWRVYHLEEEPTEDQLRTWSAKPSHVYARPRAPGADSAVLGMWR